MGASDSRPVIKKREEETRRLKLLLAVARGRQYFPSIPQDDILQFPIKPHFPLITPSGPEFQVTVAPSRTVPTLLREIWEKIVWNLRREMGPRAMGNDAKQFHQHDLTVAMRVNKMFYSIAAPILYVRIITLNPKLLFSHTFSQPISPDRHSKLELFQYTQRLDIGYVPEHCLSESELDPPISKIDRPMLSRAGLFPVKSRWPGITLLRDMDLAYQSEQSLETIRRKISTFSPKSYGLDQIGLFSNLKTLTVGAFGKSQHSRWDAGYNFFSSNFERYKPSHDFWSVFAHKRENDENLDLAPRRRFGYEITSPLNTPNLQHICVDNFTGPYSIFKTDNKNLKSYTIHITKSIVDTGCKSIPIIPGIKNRWIIEPEAWERRKDTGKKDWIVDRGSTYQWLFGKVYELDPLDFECPGTELVIYGALNEQILDEEYKYLSGWLVNEWDMAWDWERKKKEMDRFVGVEEKGIKEVRLEDEIQGQCDACGARFGGEMQRVPYIFEDS
ncbi:uncharacterized protein I303_103915 [Kwoniella dejecticola CBS 10117]|uniref:Uncharacterized protein n=1 Tax=Kwoniella dejecticola CBS 10117 TaxID=1296121 RepID=A0A1A6A825_9TREE|nr:uncharacterized protein I303_03933 [Kwoniella dejecticola CBS 10117]OBR86213.1 hypothetical protein I303_03933 [Kwoniella dejecticola CBS 10117]